MKLKRIIGLALAAVMSISSFSGLYITSSAAELASYIWDLTDCGEASGYVTPEGGSARNNCTTLTVGEDVSSEYTKNITAPKDGMLSFNLSRDDTAIGKANNKATISSDGLIAPGNGAHIYFYSSKQGTLTVYANANIWYASSDSAASGYGSDNTAKVADGMTSFYVEANKYYRIRSTGTTSPITYTKIAFEEIAQQYAVKVSDNILNGTVTVDKEQATEDDIVTITATPLNKNFEVDTISVTGTNGADIEVSNNGDDTYTFTMPNQAVTINATFKASVEGNIESIKIGDMPEYIAIPSNESKNINVPIIVTDEYGGVVSGIDVDVSLKESYDGVSISDGTLVIDNSAKDGEITLIASHGSFSNEKTVKLYNPVAQKIEIDGDYSIEIPKENTADFKYSAKVYDQHNKVIENADCSWKIDTYDNTGISISNDVVTVSADAKEQTITVTAFIDEVKDTMRVTVVKNQFMYKPIDGGYEIDNGTTNYTRPIYYPHMHDLGNGNASFNYVYYMGDQPKLALSSAGTIKLFGHMFLGIKGGKWLDKMENITSRYTYGHEEYTITDSSFEGEIKLTFTRSNETDAMLVKAELPDGLTDKLVVATAGQGSINVSEPTEGNGNKLEFDYTNTQGRTISVDNNMFVIGNNGSVTTKDSELNNVTVPTDITGTSNVDMHYTTKDASKYANGVDALLSSTDTKYPMVVGTTDGNKENTVYMLMTTYGVDDYVTKYQTEPENIFENGIEYFKEVSTKMSVDTPDPYINSALTSMVMAVDSLWSSPSICHSAIGYHNGQGGWRGAYSFVDIGRNDWIKSNAKEYMKNQEADGRIWAYPTKDGRYNMNVVFVDILLQYWDWTGDDAFFKDEGGYNMIAKHLEFMDKYMQMPNSNLYENWLDAWNTDNKWNNGGGGSIATSYTWRAYSQMARMAEKFGYTEDAEKYSKKADAIKKDMNDMLYDMDKGVFGEYIERFGYQRLNSAPDLSSIYTPADMGIATDEQLHSMMSFTKHEVPSLPDLDKIWDNIDFKYSSNREPNFYSSKGIYLEEVLNNALAHYENGDRDAGMQQFRACLVPLMHSKAAGQGTAQHIVREGLTNKGHIDFGDVTAQYVRTAQEGIFGIKMNVPDKVVNITPGFPEDWGYASIKSDALSYDYKYKDSTDKFEISSQQALSYNLHIPVRSSKIEEVKVNGAAITDYTVDGYVNVATPIGTSATVTVKYGNDEKATVTVAEQADINSSYTITSNGTIKSISDPQGVLNEIPALDTESATVTLGEKTGWHSIYVTVEKDNQTVKLPVDINIIGEEVSYYQSPKQDEKYETIDLSQYVNKDLRTLHDSEYTTPWADEFDEYFYWSTEVPRTVLPCGRSWWELHGSKDKSAYVPETLSIPNANETYTTDDEVPFKISGNDGNNAVFTSLYNEVPDKVTIPVNKGASKVYFMLSVSTNNMQSRIENARITLNLKDGKKKVLPLTNPDNIDDWLCYMQTPYAEDGQIVMWGDKAHSNILSVELDEPDYIKSIDFECLSCEVLAGLLGVTVVSADVPAPEEKTVYTEDGVVITAEYNPNGTLKNIKSIVDVKSGDEVIEPTADNEKVFAWDSLDGMKPLAVETK